MSASNPLAAPVDRRSFLKFSALAGGGLMLGLYLRTGARGFANIINASTDTVGEFAPNAYLRISPQGVVTLISKVPECGQGIKTSLPMVIAEELSVDWNDVVIEVAEATSEYSNPWYGAGGSTSTPNHYDTFRRAGASARMMLVTAAAQTWEVSEAECFADDSAVTHKPSGRKLRYGELVAAASKLPVPEEKSVVLKDPKEFKLLGRRVSGVDNPKLVTGQPLFGIDTKLPGMLYAVYEKCPVFGGKVVSANLDDVKALPGVKDAFVVEGTNEPNGLMPGVAIVADSTWAAFSARRALKVTWNEGPSASESWGEFASRAEVAFTRPGSMQLRRDGDVAAALSQADTVVDAVYSYPFISHANLEPQNCTAQFKDGALEIWAPTQNPGNGRELLSRVLGVPQEKIRIHVTRIGGGFGRRLFSDFMAEAAAIAMKVPAPVKLTWTREDDLRHDHYRPGGFFKLQAAVNDNGKITGWRSHFVTFGNTKEQPGNGAGLSKDEFPGRWIPNFHSEATVLQTATPMGYWRAPGSCTIAWVMHSFIDELAYAAGGDPLQFRLNLLGDGDELPGDGPWNPPYNIKRMRAVVQEAARLGGYPKPMPKGRGRGLAFHFSHRGYVAQVADVTVSKDGTLKVDKVTCVCDVGSQIVNLSGAENQVQGSIIDGIGAALYQDLDIERGRVVQSNFHDYPMIRMPDTPPVIDILFLKTDFPTTGLGEPALPPIAPAICNAIYAAIGKRIRTLPITKTDLSWS